MEREVIVVYTTEEDDENVDPNAPASSAMTSATNSPEKLPPEVSTPAVEPDDTAPTAPPAGTSSPAALPSEGSVSAQGETSCSGSHAREHTDSASVASAETPHSTRGLSFSIPSPARSGRPLKQLLIQSTTTTDTGAEKRRRSDVGSDRQARATTVQLRPLYRSGQSVPGDYIPAPPPLRPAQMTTSVAMTTRTHVVAYEGERLDPAQPPQGLPTLGVQFNPDGIVFQNVAPTRMCRCSHPCRVNSCDNAAQHFFCAPMYCPFEGTCGNGLDPSRNLTLMQNNTNETYTVMATHAIDAHVVIGEYLGRMRLETFKADERPKNEGCRLYMHHDPDHPAGARVCIEAKYFGNLLRYVNHSCFANARFRQVCNGRAHTVVIVTNRRIERGEEILVDYGHELWFLCRCASHNCRHRGFVREISDADYTGDADDEMGGITGTYSERQAIRNAVSAGVTSGTPLLGDAAAARSDAGDAASASAGESDSDFE